MSWFRRKPKPEAYRFIPVRKAGHRGRKPVKAVGDRFNIGWLDDYLTTALPAPVYPIDVSGGITAWGMLGNGPDPTCTSYPDGVGDCTFAGRQHAKMAKAAAANLTETWENSNALVSEYLTYDHGQDEGAVIADLLLAWYKDGKILAFAPVDHTNPATVDAAMAAFHGCYVGVTLPDNADQQFEDHQTWSSTKPDPDDGHCIVKVRADSATTDTYVTWGALQNATKAWTRACLDEAWVIITAEDQHLVNLDQLKADIEALGGTGGAPFPAPAPVPTPVVVGPTAADLALAPVAELWVTTNHTGKNATMAKALKTWLAAQTAPSVVVSLSSKGGLNVSRDDARAIAKALNQLHRDTGL